MFDNMDIVLAYMRAHPKYSDLDIRYALLSEYFEGKQKAFASFHCGIMAVGG